MPISSIDVTLVYPDNRRDHIRLREKALNQGADGLIYAAPDGKLALKLYHNPEKDPERPVKIRQMLQTPPDDNGLEHFAWPIAQAVNRKGRFIGYAMPLLPLGQYTSLELLLTRKGRRLANLPESRAFRIKAAENLARRVAQLHAKGHCVIDLKPANLLVHRKTADIVVVDCDGFAIQGEKLFIPGHQYTAGYIAPEAWRNRVKPEALGKAQDLFALAVIIFQLVNEGVNPYQGVPRGNKNIPGDTQNRIGEALYAYGEGGNPHIAPSPWSLHDDFPPILSQTFDQAFADTPERPASRTWVSILALLAGKLRQCKKDKSHFFWGATCRQCAQKGITVRVAPQKSSTPTASPFERRHANRTILRSQSSRTPQAGFQQQTNPVLHGYARKYAKTVVATLAVVALGYFSWDQWRNEVRYLRYFESNLLPEEEQAVSRQYSQQTDWIYLGRQGALVGAHRSEYPLPESELLPDIEHGETVEDGLSEVPHFEVGEFSSHDRLRTLVYLPLSPIWEFTRRKTVTAAILSTSSSTYLNTSSKYSLESDYYLRDWYIHPQTKALYVRQCEARMECRQLGRIALDGNETVIQIPDINVSNDSGSTVPAPWYFAVTKNDERVVIATNHGLRIHSSTGGNLIAEVDFPSSYSNYNVSDLEITPNADYIYIGLSQNESYALEYDATILEYDTSKDNPVLLTDFQKLLNGDHYLIAPSVSVSDDGQQLAIGENIDPMTETVGYSMFPRTQVKVKTSIPGIQILKKAEEEGWQKTGSYSLPRRVIIRTPDNPALLSRAFISGRVMGSHRFNLDFEMTGDGSRLLSGLEVERLSQFKSIARAWVLDIENGVPEMNTRVAYPVSTSFERSFAARMYPFARLSTGGKEVVIGWSNYMKASEHMTYTKNKLMLSLYAFKVWEKDPPTPPADTGTLTTR